MNLPSLQHHRRLTGPCDRPLEHIFQTLCNPASNNFICANVVHSKAIFLDDDRYNKSRPLAWEDLLLLLDGATVYFSQPRNHFFSDVCLPDTNTISCFATGKGLLEYTDENGRGDRMEDHMLRVRFCIFVSFKTRPISEVRECASCAKCFSDFMFENRDSSL